MTTFGEKEMHKKWLSASGVYGDKRMLSMLLLGFSSGFPLLLVFGTLNLWLKQVGVGIAIIGYFSLVKIPYSFKWAWAPVMDNVRLPYIGKLGRRRSWALVTQVFLFLSILGMAATNPVSNIWTMAGFAFLVAFFSASQDIVLDAYRIESFEPDDQAAASAVFVLGYRFGLLFSGAVSLFMTEAWSWNTVYMFMSLGALVGMVTIICSPEALKLKIEKVKKRKEALKVRLAKFADKAVRMPFVDFMKRQNWALILVFIFLYKITDAYIGPMAYPFYNDMGFTNVEIASITKVYGMIATIMGSFIGGLIVARIGILKGLLFCGVCHTLTTLAFVGQAYMGHNVYMLMFTISIDHITAGMGTTAFVAYLSSLCNKEYTATQYALLSSLMSLARDVFSTTSGHLVELVSWPMFFLIATAMSLPGLGIIVYFMKNERIKKRAPARVKRK